MIRMNIGKKRHLLGTIRIVSLLAVFLTACHVKAYCALGDIITSYSSPGFVPRGLAWDGQYIWNADQFDQTIYKLNPATGNVVSSISSAGTNPYGNTFVGNRLWSIDISNRQFYSIDPAVGLPWQSEFATPANDYLGITYDGINIWTTDPLAGGDIVVKMDTNGNVLGSFSSPAGDSTALAWDGQYLWNADVGTDMIYKIDPTTGNVITSFAAPGGQTTGLVFDGHNLWLSDSDTGQIYQMDIGYTPAPPGAITLLTMLGGLGGWAGAARIFRRRKTEPKKNKAA